MCVCIYTSLFRPIYARARPDERVIAARLAFLCVVLCFSDERKRMRVCMCVYVGARGRKYAAARAWVFLVQTQAERSALSSGGGSRALGSAGERGLRLPALGLMGLEGGLGGSLLAEYLAEILINS